MPTEKQYRNQGPSPHVIPTGPAPRRQGAAPDVLAAYQTCMGNAAARQAEAARWLMEGPTNPGGGG